MATTTRHDGFEYDIETGRMIPNTTDEIVTRTPTGFSVTPAPVKPPKQTGNTEAPSQPITTPDRPMLGSEFTMVDPPQMLITPMGCALTKREYFAGMAMASMSAMSAHGSDATEVAGWAIEYADALIAALEQPTTR